MEQVQGCNKLTVANVGANLLGLHVDERVLVVVVVGNTTSAGQGDSVGSLGLKSVASPQYPLKCHTARTCCP